MCHRWTVRGSIPLIVLIACGGDTTIVDGGADVQDGSLFSFDAVVDMGPPWEGALPVSCNADAGRRSCASDVTPLITTCSGEICHTGGPPPWPYGALVNAPTTLDKCAGVNLLVEPGSLHGSYLVNKLTGLGMCPGTSMMPLANPPLTTDQIQIIADWICQGAPDN